MARQFQSLLIAFILAVPGIANAQFNWEPVPNPVPGAVKSLIAVDSVLYATVGLGSTYRSSDYGATWEFVTQTAVPLHNIIRLHDGSLLLSAQRLHRSTDNGVTWLADMEFEVFTSTLTRNNTYLYVGSQTNGVWRSSDEGKTWENKSLGLGYQGVAGIAALDNVVIAATVGIKDSANTRGLYRSTDNGDHWEKILYYPGSLYSTYYDGTNLFFGGVNSSGTDARRIFRSSDGYQTYTLADSGVRTGRIENFVGHGNLIVAAAYFGPYPNYGGIIYTTDGEHWESAGDSVYNRKYYKGNSVAIVGKCIIAAIQWEGGGGLLYRAELPEITTGVAANNNRPQPATAAVEQVYPNPANNRVYIALRLAKAGTMRLALYAADGELAAALPIEKLTPGSYQRSIDVQGLASGIYRCVLETEGITQSAPVILQR